MRLRVSIAAGLLATALACTSSSTSPSGGDATLQVMLTDSPFSDAKALLVTFSEVSAHATGGDFMRLPFASGASSRTCDLKRLATAQDILGSGSLPAGHYTQLRLTVTSATIYFDNASSGAACAPTLLAVGGRSSSVEIPSGELRLNREFDLASTRATTILLDFDGDRSVHDLGNGRYVMTPVVSIVSVQ
jgi:hypothetical protein